MVLGGKEIATDLAEFACLLLDAFQIARSDPSEYLRSSRYSLTNRADRRNRVQRVSGAGHEVERPIVHRHTLAVHCREVHRATSSLRPRYVIVDTRILRDDLRLEFRIGNVVVRPRILRLDLLGERVRHQRIPNGSRLPSPCDVPPMRSVMWPIVAS